MKTAVAKRLGFSKEKPTVPRQSRRIRVKVGGAAVPPAQTADEVICLIIFACFVCMLADAKGFAPAGATKGLSDRPLETFGPHTL